ncbi:MAG: hypothetical protein KJ558_10625 [Gammaproteobacteria bacterium]|nr:hypothetical protein [Gammaproteobacteria bacterium]MBU1655261.1 hypothetical protein [Gammaproteobacteria bacterium]MBU1962040.1 hypothetical protein [Gammaproteobacteria bacterium]
MVVLFDQGTPVPLRHFLPGHQVSTAYELGWSGLTNGDLLQQAESHGFELLVTTDRNLRYQQTLSSRRIAIVVLGCTSWPRISRVVSQVVAAVEGSKTNSYTEVPIPYGD